MRTLLAALACLLSVPALVSHGASPLPIVAAPQSAAAAEAQPTTEPTTAKPDLPEKKATVEEQLRVAQQTLREANEDETTSSSTDAHKVDLLKQLQLLYTQQESAAARTQELAAARATATTTLKELRENGPEEKKPYSFFLQESLQDSLSAQKARVKTAATTVEAAVQTLARATEAQEVKDKKRRQAKEKLAENSDAATELVADHDLAKLESKLAAAEVELRLAELANVKLEREAAELELQFFTEKLAKVQSEVTFSEKDLNRQLQELSKQESDITRRSKENDAEVNLLLSEWEKARQRLDTATKATPALQTEVKARWKAHNLRDTRTEYLTVQKSWVQKLRETWNRRYWVATDQFQTADLATWRGEVQKLIDELAADKSLRQSRRQDLRVELDELERLLTEETSPEAQRWLSSQVDAIRDQQVFISDHIARGQATARTAKRLNAEIRQRTSDFSLTEWAGVAWEKLVTIWEYELTKTDDEQPLRVRSVAFGLLLLVLGYRFSRRLSRTLGAKVLPRFGIDGGGAAALQMLSFYALLLTTTLMALKVVSVPLTMFTFLGGAAAIGVGFGSQNIVNNFISGLILLTEQPVRVGDLIELNGLIGCVETIGMRSTRLRTGSMQQIIVPNSSFLESNVINWTLSDTVLRCNVDVGVAYGSPTRDVARWLKRAADEHGLVLEKPEPFVWFAGFGDNSLNFELYFYITVRSLSERRRIESDLRFIIDQYFREAGISIAFPQRDLHLDTQRPLEIKMLPAEAKAPAEARNEARAA